MRLKQRPGDFHVRELLNDNYLTEKGEFAVYRITKKKMTTPEAIKALASETGLNTGDIKFAGLKDRQAVTTQYMSVPRKHRATTVNEGDLRIEQAGFAETELTSDHSRGNGFEITVRALWREDVRVLRNNLEGVREHGLINYFDDQRFGNLRHDQGWVARELMLGNTEEALKRMLFWPSPFDSARYERYKGDIGRNWGNWSKCAGISRGFGEHFSIFDHLEKNEGDFAGAFYFAPSRIRLIHLYAYQSHVWNRAAALLIRDACAKEERTVLASDEGALPTFEGAPPADLVMRAGLRLPGSHLEDCGDDKEIFVRVLAAEGLTAAQFHIEGVSGFALKGEDRPLVVVPGHLRVRPAEEDRLNRGCSLVKLRFELPRGSYATLVVKRIFEMSAEMKLEQEQRERERDENPEGGRGSRFGGGSFNKRQGQGFQDRGRDRNRDDSEPSQEGQGGYRRPEGAFAQGGGGGYQGGGNRDGGGGYQGGGNRDGGGGYQGGGNRGGGYQGGGGGGYQGNKPREGGGYQGGGGGGYQGGGGGGYQGNKPREGGGYQGGGGGGYQGNKPREGGGYQGGGGGGYQGNKPR
ncbi:MAG: tRNA pseudouridine13 synthase, partial [Bacteroidia bacterium]